MDAIIGVQEQIVRELRKTGLASLNHLARLKVGKEHSAPSEAPWLIRAVPGAQGRSRKRWGACADERNSNRLGAPGPQPLLQELHETHESLFQSAEIQR